MDTNFILYLVPIPLRCIISQTLIEYNILYSSHQDCLKNQPTNNDLKDFICSS